jgi:hypothetical protein
MSERIDESRIHVMYARILSSQVRAILSLEVDPGLIVKRVNAE